MLDLPVCPVSSLAVHYRRCSELATAPPVCHCADVALSPDLVEEISVRVVAERILISVFFCFFVLLKRCSGVGASLLSSSSSLLWCYRGFRSQAPPSPVFWDNNVPSSSSSSLPSSCCCHKATDFNLCARMKKVLPCVPSQVA